MASAASIKRLMKDETLEDVLSEVIERQVNVFLTPESSTEERDDAHDIVRAIGKIQEYFDSVIDDEIIQDRRNNK
jgi:hypothetical protein